MCVVEPNEKKYEFCFVIWTRERVIFYNNITQAMNATNNNNDVDDDDEKNLNENGEW